MSDEICTCGHLKRDHFDFTTLGGIRWSPDGHGKCAHNNPIKKQPCKCEQFTWAGFVE